VVIAVFPVGHEPAKPEGYEETPNASIEEIVVMKKKKITVDSSEFKTLAATYASNGSTLGERTWQTMKAFFTFKVAKLPKDKCVTTTVHERVSVKSYKTEEVGPTPFRELPLNMEVSVVPQGGVAGGTEGNANGLTGTDHGADRDTGGARGAAQSTEGERAMQREETVVATGAMQQDGNADRVMLILVKERNGKEAKQVAMQITSENDDHMGVISSKEVSNAGFFKKKKPSSGQAPRNEAVNMCRCGLGYFSGHYKNFQEEGKTTYKLRIATLSESKAKKPPKQLGAHLNKDGTQTAYCKDVQTAAGLCCQECSADIPLHASERGLKCAHPECEKRLCPSCDNPQQPFHCSEHTADADVAGGGGMGPERQENGVVAAGIAEMNFDVFLGDTIEEFLDSGDSGNGECGTT